MKSSTIPAVILVLSIFLGSTVSSAFTKRVGTYSKETYTVREIKGAGFSLLINLPKRFKRAKQKEIKGDYKFEDTSTKQVIYVSASNLKYFNSDFEEQYKNTDSNDKMKLPHGARGIVHYHWKRTSHSYGPTVANLYLQTGSIIVGIRYKNWKDVSSTMEIMESIAKSISWANKSQTAYNAYYRSFVGVGAVGWDQADHVTKLLSSAGINAMVGGSIVYGIYLPKSQRADALALLKKDSQKRKYHPSSVSSK